MLTWTGNNDGGWRRAANATLTRKSKIEVEIRFPYLKKELPTTGKNNDFLQHLKWPLFFVFLIFGRRMALRYTHFSGNLPYDLNIFSCFC